MKKFISTCAATGALIACAIGLAACGHKHDYKQSSVPATCTEAAYTLYSCDCGESYKEYSGEPLGHTYGSFVSGSYATCTEDGELTIKCERCEQNYTEIDPKLGHEFDYYESNDDATCTEGGTETAQCIRCEATDTRPTPALGHRFVTYIPNDDATCTKNGTSTAQCTRCEQTDTINTIGSKLAHEYENGICKHCETPEPQSSELQYRVMGGEVYITLITTDSAEIVIPNEIDGKPVTAIADGAAAYCTVITSATIPDSVISIGRDVFHYESFNQTEEDGATYVEMNGNPYFLLLEYSDNEETSFTVNENTKFIASGAFRSCAALTDVTIPEGVVHIGASAFSSCRALERITLPNSLRRVGDLAFGAGNIENLTYTTYGNANYLGNTENPHLILVEPTDRDNISSCTIHSNTKFIYSLALYQTNVTSISIPNGVVQIGTSAFSNCYKLETVTFGNGIKYIGGNAFSGCTKLKSASLPDSVIELGSYAFHDCRALATLKLPSGLTEIPYNAFSDCYKLSSVTIPNSVTTIGSEAFDGCIELNTVTIPNSVTVIGDDAFGSCDKLKYTSYDTGLYLGNSSNPYLVLITTKSNTVTSCTVHADTKIIAGGAFGSCRNLESLSLPNGITYIGYDAFEYCYVLKSITFDGTVDQWEAIDIYYDYQSDLSYSTLTCKDGKFTIIDNRFN